MSLWKDKGRGDWRWEFQYRGHRHTGAGYKTKTEAREERELKRKEVKTGSIPGVMGFREAANLYLDYSKMRHADKTYKYKRMVYQLFMSHSGNLFLHEITPQMIHQYLSTRPSNRNYNAHKAELSSLFTFCIMQMRVINENPCQFIQDMPHTPKKPVMPTEEDIIQILLAAKPETELPILLIIIHTMARIDEVLRLTWDDVNFSKREVTLYTRKRASGAYEPDELFINDDLLKVFRHLWKIKEQNNWVFYNRKAGNRFTRRPKMMRSICERAKVKPLGFHALRHFIASYLLDNEKIGKKTVSELLRHSNLRTTDIYIHSLGEGKKNALKRLEGKFATPFVTLGDENHKRRNSSQREPLKLLTVVASEK